MSAHTVTATTLPWLMSFPIKSWRRSEPAKTFWSDLCKGCRNECCETSIFRHLGKQKAWDIAGPALWHWNDTLPPIIKEYFDRNRASVLKQDDWLASIDCWMVGSQLAEVQPTVVVTCSAGSVAKRLKRLIRDDRYIQSSGFAFVREEPYVSRCSERNDHDDACQSDPCPVLVEQVPQSHEAENPTSLLGHDSGHTESTAAKPIQTSTRLSALANSFVNIGLNQYEECEKFVQDHPDIL